MALTLLPFQEGLARLLEQHGFHSDSLAHRHVQWGIFQYREDQMYQVLEYVRVYSGIWGHLARTLAPISTLPVFLNRDGDHAVLTRVVKFLFQESEVVLRWLRMSHVQIVADGVEVSVSPVIAETERIRKNSECITEDVLLSAAERKIKHDAEMWVRDNMRRTRR